MRIQVTVNGQAQEADVDPRVLLVHFLRDNLGLTGTKIGCDTSQCGACVVKMDGATIKSCTCLAVQADGGYCTAGMIMTSVELLERNPNPTAEEVRQGLEGNICRCTGYHNIVKAGLAAAEAKGS